MALPLLGLLRTGLMEIIRFAWRITVITQVRADILFTRPFKENNTFSFLTGNALFVTQKIKLNFFPRVFHSVLELKYIVVSL